MPAVSAMAKAPQKTTRAAARQTFAPPAWAPTAPSTASVTSEAVVTMGMIMPAGETTTASSGRAAPTEKVAAEVSAAWIGRAVDDLGDAELVAGVGAERVLRHQLRGDWRASSGSRPRLPRRCRQLVELALGVARAPPSRARSARSVSDCELTETYSPAAIDMAPATSPAMPAIRMRCWRRGGRDPDDRGWPSRRCRHWRRAPRRAASRCGRPDGASGCRRGRIIGVCGEASPSYRADGPRGQAATCADTVAAPVALGGAALRQ